MPGRTIGGIPIIGWVIAVGVGIAGFAWFKKKGSASSSAAAGAAAKTPSFTQAQEVQDFQIFSALTSAQQGSDLNFLSEVAGLFSGGSSTGTTGTGAAGGGASSPIPSPAPTGTAPPATVPASGSSSDGGFGNDEERKRIEAILAAGGGSGRAVA